MADAFTQVPADSTGDKIDTEELTVGANTVNRQRIQIAGTSAAQIAPVSATDGLLVNLGTNNDVVVSDGGSAISVDDNGGSLTVDGSVSIGAALPAGTNNIGDVDVLTEPATAADNAAGLPSVVKVVAGYDGANVQAMSVDASGNVQVDVVGSLPAGTANIGDVDVASIAAGTNKIGVVGRDIVTPTDGGTALTVSFAEVDAASSGDNSIVAAQGAGNAIRVISYTLVASGGANTCEWRNGTTPVSGGMAFAANGGAHATCEWGLFQTSDNAALNLNLSAATSVDGHITYVVV